MTNVCEPIVTPILTMSNEFGEVISIHGYSRILYTSEIVT